MTGVAYEEQTVARLIEQLMVLANEQVAAYLEDARLPTLYRVHERPEPQSVAFMIEQLASLDVRTPPVPENMSAQQGPTSRRRRRAGARPPRVPLADPALAQAGLLQPAEPRSRRAGQRPLLPPRRSGATRTSWPTARCSRAGTTTRRPGLALDEAGIHSSAVEREAMQVERDADDVCLAFLLERNRPEGPLEGEVVGLIEKGVFVRFGEEGYEGFRCGGSAAGGP